VKFINLVLLIATLAVGVAAVGLTQTSLCRNRSSSSSLQHALRPGSALHY